MQSLVFKTPGLIDIRSFTTLGLNVKPNSPNPIGFFGTGLKYSISILTRLNIETILYIGKDEYRFEKKPSNFRGQDYNAINMKIRKFHLFRRSNQELPFTTEFGKTWELWQVYRELEANTRDENGITFISSEEYPPIEDNTTTFIIRSKDLIKIHQEQDKIFLPENLVKKSISNSIQIIDRQSKYLYYRGLRVYDLKKPSLFTYNILQTCDLTEDRTLKYEFSARGALADYISRSEDEDLIEKILTCDHNHWEQDLEFDYTYHAPSEAFMKISNKRKNSLSRSAIRYYSAYDHSHDEEMEGQQTTWEIFPTPWNIKENKIISYSGTTVCLPYDQSPESIQALQDICDICNRHEELEK